MSKKVILEANIGSGKSTLLAKIKEILGDSIDIIFEPVDTWTKIKDSEGKNLLGYFYNDIKRWAYTFQSVAFRTRIEAMENLSCTKPTIVERSIFTDKNVFAKNCYENGLMNDIEWQDYCHWHEWLSKKLNVLPDLYIYLRVTPEVSYQRLKKRSRDEEVGVGLDYLTQIHKKHEEWLFAPDQKIPVLIIDGDQEFESDEKRLNDILDEIKNKINSI